MHSKDNVVFYNGFWYSTFSPFGDNHYELLLNEEKLFNRLKDDIRLLALIFDVIHVPRSHLLTFQNNTHWSVVNKYVLHKDFDYLTEYGVIKSSSLPYIDEYSDTERITERVSKNNWSDNLSLDFTKIIKNLPSIDIDSNLEAKNNVDSFQTYISFLKNENRNVGQELDEIKKKSNYGDIPFFHEMFIEELYRNNKIDSKSKEHIWKITNSLYMNTGCLDLGENRRININERIEGSGTIHDNTGMLKELYSPKFIETLISEELGDKYLIKYLSLDIKDVMSFRYMELWTDFKTDIFSMFETLTQLEKIRPDEFASFKGHEKLMAYKKYIVGGDKAKFANLTASLVELAAGAHNPILGKTVKTANSVIAEMLIKRYSDWKIKKTISKYKDFWKKFKSRLDEV